MTIFANDRKRTQFDLWGERHDIYTNALATYGEWPTTIWTSDYQDKRIGEIKKAIGDLGESRGGDGKSSTPGGSFRLGNGYLSIFSPALAASAINMYAKSGGNVYDPFAGGGTRAIMAAAGGQTYKGGELRIDEALSSQKRIDRAGFGDQARIFLCDARNSRSLMADDWADLILTCPPYWNLERYGGGDCDLSEMSLEDYGSALDDVALDCFRVARPGCYAVWVIGLHRSKDGQIAHLPMMAIQSHQKAGWLLCEDAIHECKGKQCLYYTGTFSKGRGHLIRRHEHILVFAKPMPDYEGVPPRHVLRLKSNGK